MACDRPRVYCVRLFGQAPRARTRSALLSHRRIYYCLSYPRSIQRESKQHDGVIRRIVHRSDPDPHERDVSRPRRREGRVRALPAARRARARRISGRHRRAHHGARGRVARARECGIRFAAGAPDRRAVPAASDGRSTSVGALAIERRLRPMCYQDFPEALLPAELRSSAFPSLPHRLDGVYRSGSG
jgi:hypothetical protein